MGVKTYIAAKLAISIVMLILTGEPVFAEKAIYVHANVTGAGDGTNWKNAYNLLQDALADANSSEKPVEIRVA